MAVGVGLAVGVLVGVTVAVTVGVGLAVGVCVGVGVAVGVNVAVGLAVDVGVAVGVGVGTPKMFMHCENSEVSIGLPVPSTLVAVAVATVWPVGRGNVSGPKLALQFPSVVTTVEPRKCCPCPNPLGSHWASEKNSRRNVVLDTLSNDPETITFPVAKDADDMTG